MLRPLQHIWGGNRAGKPGKTTPASYIRGGWRNLNHGARYGAINGEMGQQRVWYQCDDLELCRSPEGLASAFLAACAAQGMGVQIDNAPLESTWVEGSRFLLKQYQEWFGWSAPPPQGKPARPALPSPTAKTRGTGLFFTGGLDSWYSLLTYPEPITHIIYVSGFDMWLWNRPALDAREALVRKIASERGVTALIVRSNLREHYLLHPTPWICFYGGPMMSVAHLLSNELERVVLSSSTTIGETCASGSHHDIDHYWASDRLSVVNYGNDRRRLGKLEKIIDKPGWQQQLMVCNHDPRIEGNCGRCEKCIRTRLIFTLLDQADPSTMASDAPPVTDLLNHMPRLPQVNLREPYRDLLQAIPRPGALPDSIEALLERSEAYWKAHPPTHSSTS